VSSPREAIVALVAREPGLHLREMPRRLGFSLRAVRYHLDRLIAEGRVRSEQAGGFVRFFSPSAFSKGERAVLCAARVAGQRALMEALVGGAPMRFADLRAATGLSKGSLAWHLNSLEGAGVAARDEAARFALCDRGAAEMALALTRPTVADALADAATEIFDAPK